MGKDPAFLFYPGDWLGGTLGMTFEEKGAYMELLMLQFNRGHMTEHMIGQTVGQLWVKVQDKFIKDDQGLYYNGRLQIEIEKRQRFIESRLNNVSGKNQYTKNKGHTGGHMTDHMEDRNRNEDEYKNIVELYHNLCPKMNGVKAINKFRQGLMNTRLSEYGIEKITEVLRKAGESDFLNGKNDKAWKADFEWILRPQNFVKVMEGKYENKKGGKHDFVPPVHIIRPDDR